MTLEAVLSTLLGIVSATVIFLIQDSVKEKHKREELLTAIEAKQKEETLVLKEGIKALLHDRIIQKCEFIIRRGYVTADDLEELEYLNKPYKALGGNGTVEVMLREVHKLPKKEREETKNGI